MLKLYVEVPYASFRKSYARSYAETYPLPPPSTIYGMLLSLVGEKFRQRHEGVRLAFAYKHAPQMTTTLRKLSRYKYGVPGKQSKLGNAPDFIETLCDIEFLCWVDSSQEKSEAEKLEARIIRAISSPGEINRYGVLCLGLSDDAVNAVSLCEKVEGKWHRLIPGDTGAMELPVWVDHVGSAKTRWQRYELETQAGDIVSDPGDDSWNWTEIIAPS
ncbi:MAG: type I-MYXAN CRISPR-associated protein Cas5/Cmx5/DevS [Blastocatellia bacterium]|nr:type I-MYXAN CRISPR-associated protein Cas5/Cmx5/DevS [Blastocatellia bacterium]